MPIHSAYERKRRIFGQHFLKDQKIAELIADHALNAAIAQGCESLIEIGPGKGAITSPLIARLNPEQPLPGKLREIILCEMDTKFANRWKEKLAESPKNRVRVEEADFLELPEERWLKKPPLAVMSNLPYSTGTAILDRLARKRAEIPVMVLMFQAEVAQRIRAVPGTKDWGSLSLWVQSYWDVKKIAFVPPRSFNPPPKVDSEVIELTRRAEPRFSIPDESLWERLLRVGFAHRRKMLRSGLPASGPWRKALVLSGLDGTKRAEALDWEEWQRFYAAALEASQITETTLEST